MYSPEDSECKIEKHPLDERQEWLESITPHLAAILSQKLKIEGVSPYSNLLLVKAMLSASELEYFKSLEDTPTNPPSLNN